MDMSRELPVWTPERHTRIDLPDFCFMHGGPTGMQLPEHEHTETQLELHFLSRGEDRQMAPAELPAFLRLIPSGKAHVGRWAGGNEVIVVLLGQEYIAKAKDELLLSSPSTIMDVDCAIDPVLQALGTTLRREFLIGGVADRVFLEALGTVLSGQVVRQWTSHSGERRQGGRLTPAQLRRVMEAMEDGRIQPIASLAAEVGLGSHQFTRLFQQTTGRTPYQFLLHRRLTKACALLESGELSLVQIALQLGFASQSHFTSVFQKHFRSTPSRYRRDRQSR
jgi:AraC family transcriptional regulator